MSEDFLQVYEDNVWPVYGYLAYRAASRADAEDLLQVTFERAYRAWTRYDPERAGVRTWLLAIARNALIDETRRGERTGPAVSISADEAIERRLPAAPGPEDRIGSVREDLHVALRRLLPREQEVLALRFGGDLRGPEIAEALGISLANVHQITARALKKLRTELEARGGEGPTPVQGSG